MKVEGERCEGVDRGRAYDGRRLVSLSAIARSRSRGSIVARICASDDCPAVISIVAVADGTAAARPAAPSSGAGAVDRAARPSSLCRVRAA